MNALREQIRSRLEEGWHNYFDLLEQMKEAKQPYRIRTLKTAIHNQSRENRIIDSIIEKELRLKPVTPNEIKKLILIKWNK